MSSDDNEEQKLKRLTVRELREKAVKSLGSKVAAGLKLKQELIDALVAKSAAKKPAAKAEKAEKAEKIEKAVKAPKASAPRAKAAPKKTPPKVAAAKKTPPKAAKKSAPKPVAAASAPKAKKTPKPTPPAPAISAPKVPSKPSKSEAVMKAYELPITRDFFVDPKKPSLPASYGDDRLLCFRREPLAIVVSWDLSAATFENGQGISLELVTAKGKLAGQVTVGAPTGLATFDDLPEGEALTVQVVRRGRVMTRGRPFIIGSQPAEGGEGKRAFQMTVPIDQPLPKRLEKREWVEGTKARAAASQAGEIVETTAPVAIAGSSRMAPGTTRRASSSRLSS